VAVGFLADYSLPAHCHMVLRKVFVEQLSAEVTSKEDWCLLKAAVIVIDMINDFVTGVFKSNRAAKIISNIKALLDYARKKEIPVIYATDAHLPGIDPEFDVWGKHAEAGSWGADIVDELKPKKGDLRVLKRKYSAFQGTDLDQLLRELKVDTVILTGVVTDICIQHTAADAFFKGYKIIVPKDCVEAVDAPTQEAAIRFMRKAYGPDITTSVELLKKWA
jgi:nicotinamidase-related amidase